LTPSHQESYDQHQGHRGGQGHACGQRRLIGFAHKVPQKPSQPAQEDDKCQDREQKSQGHVASYGWSVRAPELFECFFEVAAPTTLFTGLGLGYSFLYHNGKAANIMTAGWAFKQNLSLQEHSS
jgi:hypothetical protein